MGRLILTSGEMNSEASLAQLELSLDGSAAKLLPKSPPLIVRTLMSEGDGKFNRSTKLFKAIDATSRRRIQAKREQLQNVLTNLLEKEFSTAGKTPSSFFGIPALWRAPVVASMALSTTARQHANCWLAAGDEMLPEFSVCGDSPWRN